MIKKLLKKSLETPLSSFVIKELMEPHFDPNWHFHPHYQLFTVIKGTGTRFIGDDIRHFEEGDTVFIGPNIPHLWQNDKLYFEGNPKLKTHGIVIYFSEDFLGRDFFEKPEMQQLKQLLNRSSQGIQFNQIFSKVLQKEMKILLNETGFKQILGLMSILEKISKNIDYKLITSFGYINNHKVSETNRMQKVHEYVLSNFKSQIKLTQIAALINMSEAAFCRYFKNRTNKTFSTFIAEIRIGYACKLLIKANKNIAIVAAESGFNTVSNFNKQFKEITKKTPLQYQKEFLRS